MKINQKNPSDGSNLMIAQKKMTEILFKNIGLFSIIVGLSFLVLGLLNFGILPCYYLSKSGNSSFDGVVTILVNGIIWMVLCIILLIIGVEFYFSGKRLSKTQLKFDKFIVIRFCLIAAILICGTITYIILILMNVLRPLQFFPNVLFAGEETLMDFSPIFNALLFFLLISILYRVAYKLIKYGFKIGELK